MNTLFLKSNNTILEEPSTNKVIGIKTKSYKSKSEDIIVTNNNNTTLEEFSTNKVIGIKTNSYKLKSENIIVIDNTYIEDYNDEISKYEKVIEHFKKNNKKYKMLVILVPLLIPASTLPAYALASKTSSFTIKVYQMGKDIGKIICAIGVIAESSKCVLTGSVDQLGKIGVKYLSFGLLIRYLEDIVSWVFN